MSDFAPPSGPPPPKVPAGWRALWNSQYNEWYYVNIYTKKSQWDKPTEPVYGEHDEGAPAGPPPGYNNNSARPVSAEKNANLYNPNQNVSEDERLARQMQQEEDAKNRGLSDSYYGGPGSGAASGGQYGGPSGGQYGGASGGQYGVQQGAYSGGYGQQAQQQQQYSTQPEQKKGFLGKILGKTSSSSPAYGQQQYGQPHYGGQQYGYGQQPQYVQQPARRTGGIGMGGAALGLGGGLLGGMLIGDMIGDAGDGGGDGGDGGGGDMGGGDMGGGDMGGGGDF